MNYKYIIIIPIVFLTIGDISYSQYKDESYIDLTSQKTYFTLGYLKINQSFPERFNMESKSQSGLQIGTKYNIKTIEEIEVGNFTKARLNIGGSFMLGFTYGNDSLNIPDRLEVEGIQNFSRNRVKSYTVLADLFTMNVNFEYFLMIPGKRSVELSLAVSGLNIGGTVTYFEAPGSWLNKNYMYSLNFLPLYIEPTAKIRFQGATLGIGLLLNPYNFFEYRGGLKGYYSSNEEGIKQDGASQQKYSLNIYLNF